MALPGAENAVTIWMVRGNNGRGGMHGIENLADLEPDELIYARMLAQIDYLKEKGDVHRHHVLYMEILRKYEGDRLFNLQDQHPEMFLKYVDQISQSPFSLQEIVRMAHPEENLTQVNEEV